MNNSNWTIKKAITPLIIAIICIFSIQAIADNEKPLLIKGLFIGMNANQAKTIISDLLPKAEWKVTEMDKSSQLIPRVFNGDSNIFGNKTIDDSRIGGITGDYGFAIIDKDNSYEGFIGIEEATGKVIRMSFSGRITDILFASSAKNADQFASSFWTDYNMPAFNWIPRGWIYSSPLGYVITIKTDKFIDINKQSSKFFK
ncbi:MAG: hypothetical protein ABFD50_00460 [Smithella sp.]